MTASPDESRSEPASGASRRVPPRPRLEERAPAPAILDGSDATANPGALPQRRAPHRLKQLDLLRAFAILLVLVHHSGIKPESAGWLAPLFNRVMITGWIGVDCFFVLSGFLIGGLIFAEIQKTGSFDSKRFFIRRAFKIWPQYYAYLIFFFLLGITCFGYSAGARLRMMLFALINLQNYSRRWESHIWSLAVEEHFYLLLPLAVVLILPFYGRTSKCGLPWLVWVGVAMIVGVTAGRFLLGSHQPFNLQLQYFGTHARLDSLGFGVLTAYVSVFHREFWDALLRRPLIFGLLAVLLISPVVLFAPDAHDWFTHTFGYSLLYLGFGALLVAAMGASQVGAVARWLEGSFAGVLAWVGVNSYGIYLWHQDVIVNPLVKWVYPRLRAWPDFAAFTVEAVLIVVGSALVGALSTRGIERPMLALRDRLWPSRSARAV